MNEICDWKLLIPIPKTKRYFSFQSLIFSLFVVPGKNGHTEWMLVLIGQCFWHDSRLRSPQSEINLQALFTEHGAKWICNSNGVLDILFGRNYKCMKTLTLVHRITVQIMCICFRILICFYFLAFLDAHSMTTVYSLIVLHAKTTDRYITFGLKNEFLSKCVRWVHLSWCYGRKPKMMRRVLAKRVHTYVEKHLHSYECTLAHNSFAWIPHFQMKPNFTVPLPD